jgi:glycosyltransferase involved in cell wall biosynthesis
MRIIAMVPVRNEEWVLPHSLAALSGFCDVILVSDRGSTDGSLAIYRQFPKVVVLNAPLAFRIREQRWQMLDAARGYDGRNLLWATDADEMLSPRLMKDVLERSMSDLTPGASVDCRYYHLWNSAGVYRDDLSYYRPNWKRVGFVDDRRANFDRSLAAPLHEPRIPVDDDVPGIRAGELALLHLQWVLPRRNQIRQAWYRCREYLDGGKTAAAINDFYATTLPVARVKTTPVPHEWVGDLTFPDLATVDSAPCWQQADLTAWFDQRGIEFFESLEIWHNPALAAEFRRRVGRHPTPDRSYLPTWPARARTFSARVANAVRRRIWSPPSGGR